LSISRLGGMRDEGILRDIMIPNPIELVTLIGLSTILER